MDARSYLAQAPSPRFVWLSLLAIWLAHALTWWAAAQHRGISLEALFLHYDAGWYAGIATRGYFGSAWAFYPLWPALVAGVSRLVPLGVALLQPILAAGLFLLAVRLLFTDRTLSSPLVPTTRLGWLLFALAPASFVFHSGHTEALFVLLSVAAFARASRGAWLSAAVLAGLSALTRNQGTLVAVAVGLWSFRVAPSNVRWQRFVVSGVVSAALFALYPLYQYVQTGDPFIALKAQGDWTSSHGLGDALKTLVLGNARDPWEWATRARHPWFIGYLVASALYLGKTRDVALSVYFFGCVLAMLLQGTVSNLFRYTVILPALMFFVGDSLTKKHVGWQLLLLAVTLYFHAELTWNYGVRRWPY